VHICASAFRWCGAERTGCRRRQLRCCDHFSWVDDSWILSSAGSWTGSKHRRSESARCFTDNIKAPYATYRHRAQSVMLLNLINRQHLYRRRRRLTNCTGSYQSGRWSTHTGQWSAAESGGNCKCTSWSDITWTLGVWGVTACWQQLRSRVCNVPLQPSISKAVTLLLLISHPRAVYFSPKPITRLRSQCGVCIHVEYAKYTVWAYAYNYSS